MSTHTDVIFHQPPERDLTLDLYRPSQNQVARPALVLAHGGAWKTGDKGGFGPQVTALVKRGYIVADTTYRLSNEAQYPAALKDVKAAVRWLRANSESYGIDPDRIAIGGHSAGAHLAALVSVTDTLTDLEPNDGRNVSSHVAAAVCFSGIYDFNIYEQEIPEFVQFLGGEQTMISDRYREASPIEHVTSDAPPTLLLHSTEDPYLPYENAVAYQDALVNVSAPAELMTVSGGGHSFLWQEPWARRAMAKVVQFLQTHV